MSGWECKEATLSPRGSEGRLRVTLVSKETGEERQGAVRDTESFNTQVAVLFCQSMGYNVKGPVWGRAQSDETVPLRSSPPKYVGVRHKERHINNRLQFFDKLTSLSLVKYLRA